MGWRTCAVVFLASVFFTCSREPVADWTIMVYLSGDNPLQNRAMDDFKELAAIGSSRDVHVIVQFDRTGNPSSDEHWGQTLRFRVKQGMVALPSSAYADLGEQDMSSGATVADFVRSTRNAFPAHRYALMLWGHGSGPTRRKTFHAFKDEESCDRLTVPLDLAGFKSGTPDSSTGGPKNVLYGRELEDALKGVLRDEKLDLLIFDECVMGMMENAYALRDVARVMVASEEVIPETSFDNADWLSRLEASPRMSAERLGKVLVDSYTRTYQKVFPCHTMSAVDLGRIPELGKVISEFSDVLVATLSSQRDAIREARSKCTNYGGASAFGSTLHSIDLERFCVLLASRTTDATLRRAANDVVASMQRAVLRSRPEKSGDSRGSHGLAIYFPPDAAAYCEDRIVLCAYERNNHRFPLDFVNEERWTLFLHAYVKAVSEIRDPDAPQPASCDTPQRDCEYP